MKNQAGNASAYGAIVGLVIGGVAGWFLGVQHGADLGRAEALSTAPKTLAAAPKEPAQPKAPPVKYGFEADRELGWKCGVEHNAVACKAVGHTNALYKEGVSSMKLGLELLGASRRHRSGEVWVDVNNVAPAGEAGPVDLSNRTLSVWVYPAAGAAGEPERPNGFQLFIKDGDWTPKYGPWHDVKEGQWMEVAFPVGGVDGEFDPSVVNAIGLKIAAGEGSKAEFTGEIYIDAVRW